tara:strand:+ start:205 stop:618 length:414 start_codon:yes stop_codon:yes gene_type:complete
VSPKSKLDFSMQGISRFGIVFKIVVSFFIVSIGIYLHLMQVPDVDIDASFSIDKLAHIAFFYLSSLWFFLIVRPDQAVVIIIFMTVYAFSLELLQMSTVHRTFEWLDWFADMLGIFLSFIHVFKKDILNKIKSTKAC